MMEQILQPMYKRIVWHETRASSRDVQYFLISSKPGDGRERMRELMNKDSLSFTGSISYS